MSTESTSDTLTTSVAVAKCCVFCCKVYRDFNPVDNKPGNSSDARFAAKEFGSVELRFVKLLENHFLRFGDRRIPVGVNLEGVAKSTLGDPTKDDGGSGPFRLCEDCWRTVSSFCDAIHRMRVAELEAEWRLRQLVGLMMIADKVPGRWVNFNVFLRAYREHSETSKGDPDVVKELRKKILKTCLRKLEGKASPRVVLQRCRIPQKVRHRQDDPVGGEGPTSMFSDIEDDTASIVDATLTPAMNGAMVEVCTKSSGEVGRKRLDRKRKMSEDPLSENSSTVESRAGKRHKASPATVRKFRVKQEVKEEKTTTPNDDPLNATFSDLRIGRFGGNETSSEGGNLRPWKAFANSRVFQCGVCSKILSSHGALWNHMTAIHTSDRFRCEYCSQEFKLKTGLTNHVFKIHRTYLLREFKTEDSSEEKFEKKIDAILEALTRNQGRKCDLCPKKFTTSWWCAMHIIREHRKRLAMAFQGGNPKDPSIIEEPRKKPKEIIKKVKTPRVKTAEFKQCDYCSRLFRCTSNRAKHTLTDHPAQLLHKFRLKDTTDSDFSEGINQVFERLIGRSKKQCLICGKTFCAPPGCRSHILREHEERFYEDLVSFQRSVFGASSSPPPIVSENTKSSLVDDVVSMLEY